MALLLMVYAGNDETGCSVASAGDVNKDGKDDLIIGAVWGGPVLGSGKGSAGAVYISYRSA
ncbi:MAG: integrin alpha [Candidatus Midichloria sp.]|nr:integrin alpha [Candidatus Midichloria sp.]